MSDDGGDAHDHLGGDSESVSSADSDENGHSDKYHLFGRQKPVHSALGGGRPADLLLWRNKQVSACLLTGGTVIWLLFERIGYHLLSFICHFLILSLATCFLWSNLACFVNKSPVEFPKVVLPEELCNSIALALSDRCNQAVRTFRDVAIGKNLRKLLYSLVSLWIASVVGGLFDFLTICYVCFVMMLTLPLLYEKNEDQVDTYAENAKTKLKRHYSKLDENVLQKLPSIRFTKDSSKQN